MSISVLEIHSSHFLNFLSTESLFCAITINILLSESTWIDATLLENYAQSRGPWCNHISCLHDVTTQDLKVCGPSITTSSPVKGLK